MARSTLPAAFLVPAAAAFIPLFIVRFALPIALFASASAAFALRFTLAVAARALCLAASIASPILVSSPFLFAIINSPVRNLRCGAENGNSELAVR
jgi:hypothetical protein